jgi:hypothetical protein
MTGILTTVLKVDKRGNKYVVTVQLGNEGFQAPWRSSVSRTSLDQGWCHYGCLDLISHRDPHLRAPQKSVSVSRNQIPPLKGETTR